MACSSRSRARSGEPLCVLSPMSRLPVELPALERSLFVPSDPTIILTRTRRAYAASYRPSRPASSGRSQPARSGAHLTESGTTRYEKEPAHCGLFSRPATTWPGFRTTTQPRRCRHSIREENGLETHPQAVPSTHPWVSPLRSRPKPRGPQQRRGGDVGLLPRCSDALEEAADPGQDLGDVDPLRVAHAAAVVVGDIGVDGEDRVGSAEQIGPAGVTEAGAARAAAWVEREADELRAVLELPETISPGANIRCRGPVQR